MMKRSARHGVISLAALDLRRRPDHRSELRSQLLLGEVVRVLAASPDRRWRRVVNLADGYEGWIRTWGLVEATARRAADWVRRARARVVVPFAEVKAGGRAGAMVSPVFWNSRLIVGRARAGLRAAELPDGRRGWVRAGAVKLGPASPPALAARVRSLLGVPYLWGGRTPMGMDCSAFTQQVLAEQGVLLPRDVEDQRARVRPLAPGERPSAGDLVFFGRPRGRVGHVGLVLGGGYYAHSRGQVRISSIESTNPLWDKELSPQFRGFGRPSRHPEGGESA